MSLLSDFYGTGASTPVTPRIVPSSKPSGVASLSDFAGGPRVVGSVLRSNTEPRERRPPSLLGQATGLLKSAPAGLWDFGQAIARSPLDVARGLGDMAASLPGTWNDSLGNENFADEVLNSKDIADAVSKVGRNYSPLLADITESVSRTLDVGGIRGDADWIGQRYREASKRGDILGAIVEDVGNLSLVASGAGAAAGRIARTTRMPSQVAAARGLLDDSQRAALARMELPPLVDVVQPGSGLAGRLQKAAQTLDDPVQRQTGLNRAQRVQGAGDAARKLSLALETTQPENALIYPLVAGTGPAMRAARAGVQKVPGGVRFLERMEKGIFRRNATQNVERSIALEERAQQEAAEHLVKAVENVTGNKRGTPVFMDQVDLLGAMALNMTDQAVSGFANAVLNSPDPQATLDLINEGRRRLGSEDAVITMDQLRASATGTLPEIFDDLSDAQKAQLQQAVSEARRIMVNEHIREQRAKVERGELAPDQERVPIDLVTGQPLSAFDVDTRNAIIDGHARLKDGRLVEQIPEEAQDAAIRDIGLYEGPQVEWSMLDANQARLRDDLLAQREEAQAALDANPYERALREREIQEGFTTAVGDLPPPQPMSVEGLRSRAGALEIPEDHITRGEILDHAAEIKAEQARQLAGEYERLTPNGALPSVSAINAEARFRPLGGEWDALRNRISGLMATPAGRRLHELMLRTGLLRDDFTFRMQPDAWADEIGAPSIDAAVDQAMSLAEQIAELESTAVPDSVIQQVAYDLQISEELARAAADGQRRFEDQARTELLTDSGEPYRLSEIATREGASAAPTMRNLLDLSRPQLYELARYEQIPGRSRMIKAELAKSLQEHINSEIASNIDPAGPPKPDIAISTQTRNVEPGTIVARQQLQPPSPVDALGRPIEPVITPEFEGPSLRGPETEFEAFMQEIGATDATIRLAAGEAAELRGQIRRIDQQLARLDDTYARMSLQERARKDTGRALTGIGRATSAISTEPLGTWVPNINRYNGVIGEFLDRPGGVTTAQFRDHVARLIGERTRHAETVRTQARAAGLDDPVIDIMFREDLAVTDANVMAEAALDLLDGRISDALNVSDLDKGRIEAAIVRADLESIVRTAKDTEMLSPLMYADKVRSRVQAMPERFRRHVNENFQIRVDEATARYIDDTIKMSTDAIDRSTIHFPAALRTPIAQAQLGFKELTRKALEEWKKGTDEGRQMARRYLEIAEGITTGLTDFYRLGYDDPVYLGSGSIAQNAVNERAWTQEKRGATLLAPDDPTQYFRGLGLRPTTLREYTSVQGRTMRRYIQRQAITEAATNERWSSTIGEAVSPEMRQRIDNAGSAGVPTQDVIKDLEAQGYRIVDIRSYDSDTPQAIRAGSQVEISGIDAAGTERIGQVDNADVAIGVPVEQFAEMITPEGLDIRVMDAWLADEFADMMARPGKAGRMYDEVNQVWKTLTLAWSTTWAINNALGNVLMASFAAGVNPAQIVINGTRVQRQLREVARQRGIDTSARAIRDSGIINELIPADVAGRGLYSSERMNALNTEYSGDPTTTARVLNYISNRDRSLMGRVTEWSYGINSYVDNFVRSSVYLDRALKYAPEVPAELLDADGVIRTDLTPEQYEMLRDLDEKTIDAMDRAARATVNTMGDFQRLTRLERRVIKRILPFWPWMRYQAEMMIRMPIGSPTRWALMVSLSDILGEEFDEHTAEGRLRGMGIEAPPGVAAAFGLSGADLAATSGEQIVPFGINPFAEEPTRPLSWTTLSRSITPVISTPLQITTGIRAATLKQASRPQDQAQIGDFGERQLPRGPLERIVQGDVLGGIGEIGYTLTGATPVTRRLRDAALGPSARYASGDEINVPDRMGNSLYRAARGLGVPLLPTDMTARLREAQRKDYTAGRRYEGAP